MNIIYIYIYNVYIYNGIVFFAKKMIICAHCPYFKTETELTVSVLVIFYLTTMFTSLPLT